MKVPSLIQKKIIQEARSTCPFCGDRDVAAAETHHIVPRSEGGESTEHNLIYACSNCHSKITRGVIKTEEVSAVKRMLSNGQHPYAENKVDSNILHVNFSGSVNEGVIANNVEIKETKKRVTINPPSGSIASSLAHMNYIKYLIDRYHRFKKGEIGTGNLRYAVLYESVKRRFGAGWNMVPLSRFEDLAAYLGNRIDRTKIGRIRRARGDGSYSSFNEYRAKHGFSDDSG